MILKEFYSKVILRGEKYFKKIQKTSSVVVVSCSDNNGNIFD